MFCVYPTVPTEKYRPSTFFRENLQKVIEDLFKNFYVSLYSITSCICLLKSQRFASTVSFNAIELI